MNILLCVNDDDGIGTGKLYAIEFVTANICIHLSSNIIPDPNVVCRFLDNKKLNPKLIKISHNVYPYSDYVPWHGNIYWDKITMGLPEAYSLYHTILRLKLRDWWKFSAESYEYDDKNWTNLEQAMINQLETRPEKPTESQMIRDWKKQIVTFDFSLSANEILELLNDLDEEDASEILVEYLDNHEKCQAIVRKWMVEE